MHSSEEYEQSANAAAWRLSLLLRCIAMHSVLVGITLVVAPDAVLEYFGFAPGGEEFFRIQAGVFHIAVAFVYTRESMMQPTVMPQTAFIKCVAVVFLFTYYFMVDSIPVVLLSALTDGVMGALTIVGYRQTRQERLRQYS